VDIERRDDGRLVIVNPHQNLDTGTATETEQALLALVDQGSRRIVIDFTDVPYVSSAGLRVLLATAKLLRTKGGELRVCALNAGVQEVFEISGFNTLLPVFASTAEAIQGF
jgi:anti-sigma B factor antagonist